MDVTRCRTVLLGSLGRAGTRRRARRSLSFLLALIPLFVVRSVIGIYQIRLFAEGLFCEHLVSVAFLVVLLWLVWIKPDPASDLIEITAAMIAQLILLINLQHRHDRREPPLPRLLTVGDWLGALTCRPGPVVVGKATIPESTTSKQRSAVVDTVRRSLGRDGYFAFTSPKELLYFQPADDARGDRPPHRLLQAATGAAVGRGACLRMPTGHQALADLVTARWLPPVDDVSADTESLTRTFREVFPDGIILDLETLEGCEEMRRLDQGVLARTLPAALGSVEQGSVVVEASGRWLTPIYHLGTLRLIFVLPAEPDSVLVTRWRNAVRARRHG